MENMNADAVRQEKIHFPLPDSAEAIKNLVYTVYSKANLLNKATGSNFYISESLVEEMKQSETRDDLLSLLRSAGEEALRGLDFGYNDAMAFTGFPEVDKTIDTLATAIYNYCNLGNHRIQPKVTETPNEKFSFRVWLVHLNLTGPVYKEDRKKLYSKLSGHTAFRTKVDEERWKAKRKAKKEFTAKGVQA